MSLPAHYFTGSTADASSDPSAPSPIHPAVLQHLLQQQAMQQQQLLFQLQGGAGAAVSLGSFSPAAASAAPPLYAGAPLIQHAATVPSLVSMTVGGSMARTDTASATSASSSTENSQPQTASSPSTSQSTSGEQKEHIRLHISNIPYKWRDPDLQKLFAVHGEVVEAEVIFNDRGSKGFGFVTMATKEGADAAKAAINLKQFDGRVVEVNGATAKMSGRQKAKVLQGVQFPHLQNNPHLQLAMLHQQPPPPLPLMQPTAAVAAVDPQQAALQQLLAAQAILAQYSAQQQMLQGLQPALQQQQQQQQWMLQQQMGLGQPYAASFDLDKQQRRLAEELAKQRYRPY